MNLNSSLRYLFKLAPIYLNHAQSTRLLVQRHAAMSTNVSVRSEKEKCTFQETLPTVIDTIINSRKLDELPNLREWLKKMIEYNLAGGKLNRGLTTVFAYEMLEKPEKLCEESLRDARILGWCVEIFQAFLLVCDDMMDGSPTRRGVPCWYKLPGVGLGAINDAILLHSCLNHVLHTHFKNRTYYCNLVEVFADTLFYTSMGQHLDFEMAHRNKSDYSMFTQERYDAIVKYKTAYYTYNLPISLGLYMTNNTDVRAHETAKDICLDIGRFFQMQDDYIDCYSEASVSGKDGTDIQEGKCSWFAVNALKLCSPPQRIVFESCYASKEPAHIERIKRLYDQLNLEQVYKEQEKLAYERLQAKIQCLPKEMSPALYSKLIDMIYKRKV